MFISKVIIIINHVDFEKKMEPDMTPYLPRQTHRFNLSVGKWTFQRIHIVPSDILALAIYWLLFFVRETYKYIPMGKLQSSFTYEFYHYPKLSMLYFWEVENGMEKKNLWS